MSQPDKFRYVSTASELARILGAKLKGGEWWASCPSLSHPDKNPSFSFRDGEHGSIVFTCHSRGCPPDEIFEGLRRTHGVEISSSKFERAQDRRSVRPVDTATRRELSDDQRRKSKLAIAIWSDSQPPAQQPPQWYLQARGIRSAPPASIRYNPRLEHRDPETGEVTFWPALIAAIQGPSGDVQAIQRIYLQVDEGAKKAPVTPAKMTLGPMSGAAIRLAEATETLAIGEGLETCLSFRDATGVATWCALSAGNMRNVGLPDAVTNVVIAADSGEAGVKAAIQAAQEFDKQGRDVEIALPPEGSDFNDLEPDEIRIAYENRLEWREFAAAHDADQRILAEPTTPPPPRAVDTVGAAAKAAEVRAVGAEATTAKRRKRRKRKQGAEDGEPLIDQGTDGEPASLPPQPSWLPKNFEQTYRGDIRYRFDGVEGSTWLCSEIRVLGHTRDSAGGHWSYLVSITTRDGRSNIKIIPAALLSQDNPKLVGPLQDAGLVITLNKDNSNAFRRLIQYAEPDVKFEATPRLGWTPDCRAFALSDGTAIGDQDVIYHSDRTPPLALEIRGRGELDAWRETVAALAAGNPMICFGISAALAGSLIEPLGLDCAGFHLRGASSQGKTSILRAAASVWGTPDMVGNWRATDNGLEATAAAANGSVLILDELGQIPPQSAANAVYMLGNGRGKARMSADGTAKPVLCWKTVTLSSGEISFRDKLAEVGERGRSATPGEEVRFIDIPATERRFGAFDDLHGKAGGAELSDAIKDSCTRHYGLAGPEFVARIVEDLDGARAKARSRIEEFKRAAVDWLELELPLDGQVERVLGKFALVAAAGGLATEFGITGWQEAQAEFAAQAGFELWLQNRGSAKSGEAINAVTMLRAFLSKYGPSRFELLDPDDNKHHTLNGPRAGFWHRRDNKFFILSDAWREIFPGMDPNRAARAVFEARYLREGETSGRFTRRGPEAIRQQKTGRVYEVFGDILDHEERSFESLFR